MLTNTRLVTAIEVMVVMTMVTNVGEVYGHLERTGENLSSSSWSGSSDGPLVWYFSCLQPLATEKRKDFEIKVRFKMIVDQPVTIYCNSIGKEATYNPSRAEGNLMKRNLAVVQ